MDFFLILDALLQIINVIEALFRLVNLFDSRSSGE